MKRHDSYKMSRIEFLDQIPTHWQEIRMRFLGYLYGGLAGKSANDFNQVGNIENKCFIPFTNIANNSVIDISQFQTVVIADGEKQNQVRKGDLFFLMSSENYEDVGKSAVLCDDVEDLYLNSFCKGFRVTEKNVNAKFLNFQLQSSELRHNLLTGANGFTRINLKIDKVNDLMVAIPDELEQASIVTFLDRKTAEIDGLIADKRRLIELYEEEKTAIINHAVTKGIAPNAKMKDSRIEWLGEIPEHWEANRFDFIFSFSRGLAITKENLQTDGTPCVSYGEIHSKYRFEVDPNRNELRCVDNGYLATSPKSLLKRGDFVFADTSEDIKGSGNFTYLNSDSRIFAGYHTIIANPIGNFIHRYVAYFFESLAYRNQIRSKVTGTKVYSITQSILKSTFVTLPPLAEQKAIVKYIDTECSRIDTKIEKTKKLIDLLSEYRTTLISEVVTGKIKVTD